VAFFQTVFELLKMLTS